MKTVDLHIHSTFSDGTLAPAEIVDLAKARGVHAIALTDHDTVAGVDQFLARGAEQKIETLSGIEMSATHGETSMHILGYGLDHRHGEFVAALTELQKSRLKRNQEIFDRLQRLGHDLTLDDIDQSTHGQIGRPHIAELLVKKRIVRNIDEAFYRYLRKNGSAYAPKKKFPAETAIKIITNAGGVAVLAHPGAMDPQLADIEELIVDLKRIGLIGIEALYPSHTIKNRNRLKELAVNHNLIITGGSDFHGHIKPDNPIGRAGKKTTVSYELFSRLKKKIKKLK